MLRTALLAIGAALLALAVVALVAGAPLSVVAWAAILGAVLAGGILIERRGGKPITTRPGPDWSATGERFVDPESGKLVTVFYHPRSGERRYVAG